ncbi:MAG: 30S ribosomal protein S20 [Candidatus Paceibacterota bacterium]|jgi:small subunit ribosomal protein S20
MPQTQSAKKALRQSEKKRAINYQYKKKMRDLVKNLRVLIKDGKKDQAEKILPDVYKAIDKAAKKDIIKKGNASRKKSRLTVAINKISKEKVETKKETEKPKKEKK